MSAQFDYIEMKENNLQDTRENQQIKDSAEKIPIIVSSYFTLNKFGGLVFADTIDSLEFILAALK